MKQPRSKKLAFIVKDNMIFEKEYTFDFFGGFSATQKQKTIDAFHQEIAKDGIERILEVSRKSNNPIGNALSAFNLMLELNGRKYSLECVYQSSKVFNKDVQYQEVLHMTAAEAKKYIQEKGKNEKPVLTGFNCFGINFPLTPATFFYDYIYVLALSENHKIASKTTDYDCFTDIEFNHTKQIASQARSCAIFKYLYDNNIINETIEDIHKFKDLYKKIIVSYRLTLDVQ